MFTIFAWIIMLMINSLIVAILWTNNRKIMASMITMLTLATTMIAWKLSFVILYYIGNAYLMFPWSYIFSPLGVFVLTPIVFGLFILAIQVIKDMTVEAKDEIKSMTLNNIHIVLVKFCLVVSILMFVLSVLTLYVTVNIAFNIILIVVTLTWFICCKNYLKGNGIKYFNFKN